MLKEFECKGTQTPETGALWALRRPRKLLSAGELLLLQQLLCCSWRAAAAAANSAATEGAFGGDGDRCFREKAEKGSFLNLLIGKWFLY